MAMQEQGQPLNAAALPQQGPLLPEQPQPQQQKPNKQQRQGPPPAGTGNKVAAGKAKGPVKPRKRKQAGAASASAGAPGGEAEAAQEKQPAAKKRKGCPKRKQPGAAAAVSGAAGTAVQPGTRQQQQHTQQQQQQQQQQLEQQGAAAITGQQQQDAGVSVEDVPLLQRIPSRPRSTGILQKVANLGATAADPMSRSGASAGKLGTESSKVSFGIVMDVEGGRGGCQQRLQQQHAQLKVEAGQAELLDVPLAARATLLSHTYHSQQHQEQQGDEGRQEDGLPLLDSHLHFAANGAADVLQREPCGKPLQQQQQGGEELLYTQADVPLIHRLSCSHSRGMLQQFKGEVFGTQADVPLVQRLPCSHSKYMLQELDGEVVGMQADVPLIARVRQHKQEQLQHLEQQEQQQQGVQGQRQQQDLHTEEEDQHQHQLQQHVGVPAFPSSHPLTSPLPSGLAAVCTIPETPWSRGGSMQSDGKQQQELQGWSPAPAMNLQSPVDDDGGGDWVGVGLSVGAGAQVGIWGGHGDGRQSDQQQLLVQEVGLDQQAQEGLAEQGVGWRDIAGQQGKGELWEQQQQQLEEVEEGGEPQGQQQQGVQQQHKAAEEALVPESPLVAGAGAGGAAGSAVGIGSLLAARLVEEHSLQEGHAGLNASDADTSPLAGMSMGTRGAKPRSTTAATQGGAAGLAQVQGSAPGHGSAASRAVAAAAAAAASGGGGGLYSKPVGTQHHPPGAAPSPPALPSSFHPLVPLAAAVAAAAVLPKVVLAASTGTGPGDVQSREAGLDREQEPVGGVTEQHGQIESLGFDPMSQGLQDWELENHMAFTLDAGDPPVVVAPVVQQPWLGFRPQGAAASGPFAAGAATAGLGERVGGRSRVGVGGRGRVAGGAALDEGWGDDSDDGDDERTVVKGRVEDDGDGRGPGASKTLQQQQQEQGQGQRQVVRGVRALGHGQRKQQMLRRQEQWSSWDEVEEEAAPAAAVPAKAVHRAKPAAATTTAPAAGAGGAAACQSAAGDPSAGGLGGTAVGGLGVGVVDKGTKASELAAQRLQLVPIAGPCLEAHRTWTAAATAGSSGTAVPKAGPCLEAHRRAAVAGGGVVKAKLPACLPSRQAAAEATAPVPNTGCSGAGMEEEEAIIPSPQEAAAAGGGEGGRHSSGRSSPVDDAELMPPPSLPRAGASRYTPRRPAAQHDSSRSCSDGGRLDWAGSASKPGAAARVPTFGQAIHAADGRHVGTSNAGAAAAAAVGAARGHVGARSSNAGAAVEAAGCFAPGSTPAALQAEGATPGAVSSSQWQRQEQGEQQQEQLLSPDGATDGGRRKLFHYTPEARRAKQGIAAAMGSAAAAAAAGGAGLMSPPRRVVRHSLNGTQGGVGAAGARERAANASLLCSTVKAGSRGGYDGHGGQQQQQQQQQRQQQVGLSAVGAAAAAIEGSCGGSASQASEPITELVVKKRARRQGARLVLESSDEEEEEDVVPGRRRPAKRPNMQCLDSQDCGEGGKVLGPPVGVAAARVGLSGIPEQPAVAVGGRRGAKAAAAERVGRHKGTQRDRGELEDWDVLLDGEDGPHGGAAAGRKGGCVGKVNATAGRASKRRHKPPAGKGR